MKTTLYLVRHGATAYNLERPPKLQGRGVNIPLAPIGIRQAELTRDTLACCPLDACYTSPLERAIQTASIIAAPHRLEPTVIEGLTECHVGQWEGLSWEEIANQYPEPYRLYVEDPAQHGYLGGESFADVYERATQVIGELLDQQAGQSLLVVAHHVVCRTYLAGLLGLKPEHARQVSLENCGISVVERRNHKTALKTLNCHFHLLGAAA